MDDPGNKSLRGYLADLVRNRSADPDILGRPATVGTVILLIVAAFDFARRTKRG